TIDTLSKGYRQRTCFAQAILHDPPVLVLDEPTDGLDPNQKKVVRDMIRRMGRDKAIILSTHVLEEVEEICTRVVIVSGGRLVADGTPDTLKSRDPGHLAVDLTVIAPAAPVGEALRGLSGVRGADLLEEQGGRSRFRVWPASGRSILSELLAEARKREWDLREIREKEGRLDDVFRGLTRTADVGEARSKEEA
ncbi:MAG: ATP-binding cassette domain-containing protein, partial [Kiritimatiellia bacterium]|nr:ATP-binding cassette domain-containing protein [Kiritimatiellia bacterium]